MFEINLLKNRIQEFTERINTLKSILDYTLKKKRLEEIKNELKKPDTWKKIKYVQKLKKEHSSLEGNLNKLDQVINSLKDITSFLELTLEENDEEILEEILNESIIELNALEKKIAQIEFVRMFSGENDHLNCYLDIQAGSGGTEAQDWANMLMRMYLRWAERHNFNTEIIHESKGEIIGIKSVTIKIFGSYSYGWLRTETGIHRLVRKSPFDSNSRRHTSFSSVFIYPDLNEDVSIDINPADLRVDVYRSSGAGGQHVNRTESAVRITHIPTSLVTQCQNNRSQHKNKDQAIKQMKAKLYAIEIEKKNAKKKVIEDNKFDIGWGNQIRSYILDSSRIKDLRTGVETYHTQAVLDGKLDYFIRASLKAGL